VVVVGLVLGRAVVRDMYPQDQAASQIGYVTMGMAVVPMIGPAIGGVLDETLGWQANFWMLAILGALVLALVWRDLGETAARGAGQLRRAIRANTPSFSPPAASGAIASPRPSPRARSSPISAARPYVGSEVFGLSGEVGLYFGRRRWGISSATGCPGAIRCGSGSTA
jgi:DHA1 family bicyclomycin/chloramphenicol resistance-like MFS transporter